jgi:hypothetical protein
VWKDARPAHPVQFVFVVSREHLFADGEQRLARFLQVPETRSDLPIQLVVVVSVLL